MSNPIVTYMHNNIPVAVLIVMTMLNRYIFEKTSCNRLAISFTFLFLTLMNCIWVVVRSRSDFIQNYPHTGTQWKKYALCQCIISVISFYSLNYYTHKGVPFNCFFPYSELASELLFYTSFVLITLISYVEHYYWKKIPDESLYDMVHGIDISLSGD